MGKIIVNKIKGVSLIWKLVIALLVGVVILILNNSEVHADVFLDDNNVFWEYELDSDDNAINVRVKDDTTVPAALYIPLKVNGHPVVSIGNGSTNIINDTSMSFERAKAKVTTVTIPSTVTTINAYAFSKFLNLETVNIFDESYQRDTQLETIGDYAFANCPILFWGNQKLVIPSSVKTIGTGAFTMNMNRKFFQTDSTGNTDFTTTSAKQNTPARWWIVTATFKELVIGSGVTKIGDGAFEYCKVTDLTIPANVTSIGVGAFMGSRVENINFSDTGTSLSIGDYAFSKTNITNVTLPSYSSIGTGVFSACKSLKTVTFPESFTKIPDKTFQGCHKLTSINKTTSLTEIGQYAFAECNSITTENYLNIAANINKIGIGAFSDCNGLTGQVEVLSCVTSLGAYVFRNCKNIDTAKISTSAIVEIPKGLFSGCSNLKGVEKLENINIIGDNAFLDCISLNNENYSNIVQNIFTIGNSAFLGCSGIEGDLTIPDTVVTIGDYAFSKCTGLTGTLNISNYAKSIGKYTFAECSGIESVNIPASVKTIGEYAFKDCRNISSLIFNEGLTSIGNSAFYNGLKEQNVIRFPSTLTTLGNSVFDSDSLELKEVYFKNLESKISLGSRWFGRKKPIIHFADCKHSMDIVSTLPGVTVQKIESEQSVEFNQEDVIGELQNGTYGFQEITESGSIYYKTAALYVNREYAGYIPIDLSAYSGMFTLNFNVKVAGLTYNCRARLSTSPEIPAYTDYNDNDLFTYSFNKEYTTVLAGGKIYYLHFNCKMPSRTYSSYYFKIGNLKINKIESNCDVNEQYKIQIADGYSYPNLAVKVLSEGEFIDSDIVDETNDTYDAINKTVTFNNLNRNKKVIVQRLSEGTNLVTRQFISSVNSKGLLETREPEVEFSGLSYEYLHTKYPVFVDNQDLITYTIRIYNEGETVSGIVNELTQYLPNGICFEADNSINTEFGWYVLEDGKTLKTRYLEGKEIPVATGDTPGYIDVKLVCRINTDEIYYNVDNLTPRLVTISEITDGNDLNSMPGSMSLSMLDNYKSDESYASSCDTYTKGTEDDDDFECVEIKLLKKVTYELKIQKEDIETQDILNNAEFNLLDANGELILNKTTTNGVLSFGEFSTYGAGTDIYYLEEVKTPVGYERVIKGRIELKVIKTINDDGSVTIEIESDLDEKVEEDETYLYVPIYTKEQLKKMGSGETIAINGKNYVFAKNANYILENNLDLSGEDWKPLEKINGIFDGNNYKISNMQIISEEYMEKEIGLFAEYSGKIKNLTLENVNINVNSISSLAVSEYGENCVGGLIGLAESVTIENCAVTGNITAGFENVGGFIGHSKQANIVIFENCTNYANVTAEKNIGGFIGCSKSALNINNCINSGEISAVGESTNNVLKGLNAGGFVGYAIPTDYEVSNIDIGYDESTKVINLSVKNRKVNDSYKLKLTNIESNKLKYLEGAKFNIYNSNKELLYEDIVVKDSQMDIAQLGSLENKVIYYIKQSAAPEGIDEILINDFIKIAVTKNWDSKNERYVFNLEGQFKSNLDDEEENNSVISQILDGAGINIASTQNVKSQASIATLSNETGNTNVKWQVNKVNISNSKNTGNISASDRNAAGLIAAGQTDLKIINCTNSGTITSKRHTAGIVSEILKQDRDINIEITNNVRNTGTIENTSSSSGSEGAGIIAITNANLKIKNCYNTANIKSNGIAGGIIAVADGNITEIVDCHNSGRVESNINSAGILAQNYKYGTNSDWPEKIIIKNCTNTGDISGYRHISGIAAYITAQDTKIINCTGENYTLITNAGSTYCFGGIVGLVISEYMNVDKCNINNVSITGAASGEDQYGGIVGGIYEARTLYEMNITNCNVNEFSINSNGGNTGAILGGLIGSDGRGIEKLNINNCTVLNTNVINTQNGCSGSNGGIVGYMYDVQNVNILKCKVEEYTSTIGLNTKDPGDTNAGGIVGMLFENGLDSSYKASFNVKDCIVKNSKIQNDMAGGMPTNTIGGIVSVCGYVDNTNIEKCELIDTIVTGTAGNIGGMIGLTCSVDNMEVKNCKVSGDTNLSSLCKMNAYEHTVGGMIGSVAVGGHNVIIDNCNVIGIEEQKINISASESTAVGGIIGYSHADNNEIRNCTVDYANIFEDTITNYTSSTAGIAGALAYNSIIENCNVLNSIVKGEDNESIGGIVGWIGCDFSKNMGVATIKNCKVYKSEINDGDIQNSCSSTSIAGIAGVVYYGGELLNNIIEDSTINSKSKSTGAILGVAYGINEVSNSLVRNVDVNCAYNKTGSSSDNGSTGGIIGAICYKIPKFNNNIVDTVAIKSETDIDIGGLIGVSDISGVTQFENCEAKNIVLENENANTYSAEYKTVIGGMIGVATDKVEFINSKLTNANLKIKQGVNSNNHIGGLAGYASSIKVAQGTEPVITDLNIENNSVNGAVGGIAGVLSEEAGASTVNNLSLQNITATGTNYVGGLIGCGKAKIGNIQLQNITLTGTQDGSVVGGAVGILIPGSNIDNVTVSTAEGAQTPYEITSASAAGGIVGLSDVDVTNCKVENMIIKTTGEKIEIPDIGDQEEITPIGGEGSEIGVVSGEIVGILSNSILKILNCTVNNNNVL